MKKRFTILGIVFIIFLFHISMINSKDNFQNKSISLEDLTLRQKIAQMFIIRGYERNLDLTELGVGGILLGELKTKEDFKERINKYQNKSQIKLFIAADLEGYWNPFPFLQTPCVDTIQTKEDSYILGKEHGKPLNELGFNLNFAPVAEIKDTVWKHRAFIGNSSEISDKVNYYVKGIQEQGIIATVKHYPGGSLDVKDPHLHLVKANISQEQLDVFDSTLENTSAVMIGHPIVTGAVNSYGKPSTVSKEIISELRNKFTGLIISDDINMRSLQNKYFFRKKQLFIDLVNAGNDIIIDGFWYLFPKNNLNKKIGYLEEAVKSGEIEENTIDESVKRILLAKGYKVV